MICIFCKADSTGSRSVEHIVPESLGNTAHVLPPGVVCDSCNNYFALKVEKPLLDSLQMTALRFHQGIPNKRGRIPSLTGMLPSGIPATMYRYANGPSAGLIDVPPEAIEEILGRKQGVLILPSSDDHWNEQLTSRFLAKVALEFMASRLVFDEKGIEYIALEPQLDALRNYARRGGREVWPFHNRRIHDADECRILNGEETQLVWEADILTTAAGEWYFVLSLFGLELTINYGGPEIDGYLEWLDDHEGCSPLYYGANTIHPENGIPVSPSAGHA